MNVKNQLKLFLEDEEFKKCYVVCESDTPLGILFDFSCALKSFIFKKIKEEEDNKADDRQEKKEG